MHLNLLPSPSWSISIHEQSLLWSNINLTTRPIHLSPPLSRAGKRGRKRQKHVHIRGRYFPISFSLLLPLSLFPSNACDRGAWNKREIYARERERERKSNERMGIIIPREWISTQAATTYGFVFDGINNYPAERLIYGLREVPFYKAYPSLRARLCVLSGRAIGWNLSTNSSFRKKKKEKEILDFHPSG